jgi:hypothetical protein
LFTIIVAKGLIDGIVVVVVVVAGAVLSVVPNTERGIEF